MKFLDKVFSFFRKPTAVEEVAKGFEQAYQKQQRDKEIDALLDWVEHDKPRTIAGVNAPAVRFEEVGPVVSFEGAVTSENDAFEQAAAIAGINATAIWFDEVRPIISKDEALAMLCSIDDTEIKTPNFNHQLAIRKYKTQKKNWAHWKKRGNK